MPTIGYSDESTPEYKSEVIEGRASFYDTPWKRIMAGSALQESLGEFEDQFLHQHRISTPSIFDCGSEPLDESLNVCLDKSLDNSLGESLHGSDGS